MTESRLAAITQEIIKRVGFPAYREQAVGKTPEQLADWLVALKRPAQEHDKLTFAEGRHVTTGMIDRSE
jgi:hypothetical protein